jgi:HlyD family secretion protein
MNMSKSKIAVSSVIILVVVIAVVSAISFKNGNHKTFEVKRGDFTKTAEVSGKVVPADEIDLSFEASGKIQSVNVDIGDEVSKGDVLARLNVDEINQEINESLAGLQTEQEKLAELSGSNLDQNKIDSAKESLINTLKKAYITSDDIVKNRVDTFIEDPDSRTPEFNVALSNYFLRKEIEEKRVDVGNLLDDWQISVNSLTAESVSLIDANYAIENIRAVEDLLAKISSGTDDFSVNGSITQAQIDAYIAGISSSRTSVASVVIDVNSATESLRDSLAQVPITEAAIQSASAKVDRLIAQRNSYVIIAPFDGIVTQNDIEPGSVVDSNDVVVSMISSNGLEVESFVPEIIIAGIDVGDLATIVFDAFGSDREYRAAVSHIDPRETIKDGVTTYRILLDFEKEHEEILSGMNVEIEIVKDNIADQVIIPRYLIQEDENGKFIETVSSGEVIRASVNVGMSDGRGNVIIESGAMEGDEIIIPQ